MFKTDLPTLLLVLILGSLAIADSLHIEIVYPTAADTIAASAIDSNFIYGRVSPAKSQLFINDQPVPVYDNGAFLAFLPLQQGEFTYECVLQTATDSLRVQHPVFFKASAPFAADSLIIDAATISPQDDIAMPAGEELTVHFRGTPGKTAFFNIGSSPKRYPMQETRHPEGFYWGEAVFGQGGTTYPKTSGWYQGSFILDSTVSLTGDSITVFLTDTANDTVSAAGSGRVKLWPQYPVRVAETNLDFVVLRTAPHKSYYYFLPRHVKLHITGYYGDSYRIRLSAHHTAWVERYKVKMLNTGTPLPRVHVRLMRTERHQGFSRLRVYTGERIPFRIQQFQHPQSLKIYFYGVTADTDWIRRDFQDPLFHHIYWQQEADDVYSVTVELNLAHQWGYDARYDESNHFYIDVKTAPQTSRWKRRCLANKTILLDPGHEPDSGAIGPTGLQEKDANLALAYTLAEQLQAAGARVKFTRQQEESALGERLRYAMMTEADVLLSLHHNGLPAGVNPFKNRGSSTYYYYPQSYELAKRIQQQLLNELQLFNFGLFWDNLAMCRPTQMPAVLIEPAFMIHPEEEALISTPEYRERCATAIVQALKDFFVDFRE